ncbi:MAG: hypothetical protein CNLJKLNK_00552 [Holosporales bacterium]
MEDFFLEPALEQSTHFVCDLTLCRLLLNDDCRFPWLILVPKVNGVSEIFDLSPGQQHLLMNDISAVSSLLKFSTQADKINIAAFGNITRQLHIHIIARFETDAYWPQSVIGVPNPIPYSSFKKDDFSADLNYFLAKNYLRFQ